MVTLEHALLLGVQAERVGLTHEGFDAPEQRRVGVDFVPVAGDLRGDLPLDLEQRVIAVGADQKVEDVARPAPAHGRSVPGRAIVLSKLGGSGAAAMAAISASCSASARA